MAVISARVDEQAKLEAEEIASSIGLSLSTVINVFLNRFIAERGFPFDVTDPQKETVLFQKSELEEIVKKAIKENAEKVVYTKSSYLDPDCQKIKFTE